MVHQSPAANNDASPVVIPPKKNPYAVVYAKPGAARFSISGAVARFPMSMAGIGILLMVQTINDSYALGGKIAAAYIVAQAICSPQIAKLVDKQGQAKVMRPAILVSAFTLAALIACTISLAPVWTLYVFAILSGATIGSVGAMVRTRWTVIIDDPKELHTAYSLESTIDEMIFVIGPIAATLLATLVAPYAGLIVPLVLMIVGGFWFLSYKDTEPPIITYDKDDVVKSVLRNPALLCVVAVFICVGSLFGATDVSTLAFAEEQGSKSLGGVILAIFALGSGISGLAYGARQWGSPLWKRFALGIFVLACGVSLFLLATNLWALAGVMFVTGFAISPTLINGNNLIQVVVSPRQLTEGLTWIGTALGGGVSIGSALAGSQIDQHGAHAGFYIVMYSAAISVVVVLISIPTLRKRTIQMPHQITEIPISELLEP